MAFLKGCDCKWLTSFQKKIYHVEWTSTVLDSHCALMKTYSVHSNADLLPAEELSLFVGRHCSHIFILNTIMISKLWADIWYWSNFMMWYIRGIMVIGFKMVYFLCVMQPLYWVSQRLMKYIWSRVSVSVPVLFILNYFLFDLILIYPSRC